MQRKFRVFRQQNSLLEAPSDIEQQQKRNIKVMNNIIFHSDKTNDFDNKH
jgi:hypothetical protein